MIQRIQTIFLLLSAVALGLLFKFPFASSDQPSTSFLSDSIYNIQDNPILMGLTGVAALLALIAIFMFNNRPLQLRLGYGLIVLSILLMVTSALLFLQESKAMAQSVQVNDQFGMYLPILAVVFGFLANRFIKKDDNKVKSMDRLR